MAHVLRAGPQTGFAGFLMPLTRTVACRSSMFPPSKIAQSSHSATTNMLSLHLGVSHSEMGVFIGWMVRDLAPTSLQEPIRQTLERISSAARSRDPTEKMVHADASNFVSGVTKDEAYRQVLEQAEALFEGQRNWTVPVAHMKPVTRSSNLSNAAALLWHAYKSLPAPSSDVNWAGFYTLDPMPGPGGRPQLILGPFQGKVACQTIAFGRGVCGAAAE
ncbi:hypothetical protein MAPG_05768, partial [Magnaporthiopsis poae ATCC 64411]